MSDVFDDLAKAFKVGHDAGRNEVQRHVEKRESLIRDLCRALERAQEIIVDLGEKSGSEELLKDARVYANVIAGMTTYVGSPSRNSYLNDPFIKDHWKKVVAQHEENKKELAKRKKTTSKRQRRTK